MTTDLDELVVKRFRVTRGKDGLCHAEQVKQRGSYLAQNAQDIEMALNYGTEPKNKVFVRTSGKRPWKELKMQELGRKEA